jgi:hypothetical protein
MNHSRWALRYAALAAAGLTAVAALPGGPAAAKITPAGPAIKLVTAQRSIDVPRFGKFVFLDAGVYVVAMHSALQFDVQRASYTKAITATQIIDGPSGQITKRPVPRKWFDGWFGLSRFLRITIRNTAGKKVGSGLTTFCPGDFSQQRSGPNAPPRSPFPFGCSGNPFQLSTVWGLQRGWGADAASGRFQLRLGTYKVTVHVTTYWQRFLHVSPKAATATVTIHVVKGGRCRFICKPVPAGHRTTHSGPLSSHPANVPVLNNPPASVLPDLTPVPSWGINVIHLKRKNPTPEAVAFGATVWVGGHARLDVEGFRSNGSPTMKAWQYFYKHGRVVGRTRAGTMGFDGKPGHTHWHFEQFARYRLLNASKSLALRSRKVGFCIAPTDSIDLAIPNATWQPGFLGFGGECGAPSALWVREELPLGWGDTYFQFLSGQSFNITNLPNGVYYIEIIANPHRVLHESNYNNNVSLRKIILGGTPGNRTVKVPAFHGIDPENMH